MPEIYAQEVFPRKKHTKRRILIPKIVVNIAVCEN